ncbi:site-specific integrase [Lentibacillus amyloliquefaciens]|uniref:Integrase n=1 Tax=Lentibacillus amyloliquefaciens TaxID=1472767 RepID=A0A0U4EAX9_9BACI|nr:site-specific integrase [Lentibacillus amyloliquefaciens]ALX50428.1 integrase [Lentibacillus amyloliquefaciens]
MPIYKDKQRGTYYLITRINGKQVKRRGFKTKKEAKQTEAQLMLDADNMSEENPSFEHMANEYLEWYKRRRKESSYNKTKSIIDTHLIPRIGDKKINDIKARRITKMQDDLIDEFAPGHVKKIHQVLSAVFNFAIKQEYTNDNPARRAGNVDIEEEKHINYWTLDEFKQFMAVVDDSLYYVLFMVLYYSGMRKGEALALTWHDVDFDTNTLNVDKTAYNRTVTTTKTAASKRSILMTQHVMNLLAEFKLERKPKQGYVIFGEFYKHISTTSLDRYYDYYVKQSGVKKIRIHDLRHSHASYLINKGTIASLVAARLGHKDVATTLNTYSHLYPSTEKEVISQMENDFKPAKIYDFK